MSDWIRGLDEMKVGRAFQNRLSGDERMRTMLHRNAAEGKAHPKGKQVRKEEMMKRLVILMAVAMLGAQVMASQPVQLSLTPEIAIHDSDVMIEGLVLSVWGENPQRALALGIVNGSTGDSSGLSWSWLLNYADSYRGVHWAAINYTKMDFLGWQCGFVNYTEHRFQGLQTGVVNYTGDLYGLQLGLVNFADSVDHGLQVGLLNVIYETTHFFREFPQAIAPAMVFVNWRF